MILFQVCVQVPAPHQPRETTGYENFSVETPGYEPLYVGGPCPPSLLQVCVQIPARTRPQSGIKSPCSGPGFALALAGIWRIVMQIKVIFKKRFANEGQARLGQARRGMTLEPLLWLHCSISGRYFLECSVNPVSATASERRVDSLTRWKDVNLNAKVRFWP